MKRTTTRLGVKSKLKYLYNYIFESDRRSHVVPCNTPLILISQIQRSGGTLLSQLFDDHSHLFSHPHELHWGHPNKWDWPDFDDETLRSSTRLWELLKSSFIDKAIVKGYQKGEHSNRLPFLFDRLQQWSLFRAGIEDGVSSQREVFDLYMTSFFNAWLDYQNLYRTPKSYTVAFTPRVNMFPEYIERVFRDYPDGFMISIVRDPVSWFASAKKHARSQRDMREKSLDNLMRFWNDSTTAIVKNQERFPDRYIVLLFSDLVSRTESVMRTLCERFDLPFEATLLRPTFNGIDVGSNTSHESLKGQVGVLASTLDVFKEILDTDEIDRIRTDFEPSYDLAVRSTCVRE